ncbi:MAG: potassium channel family protein [Gemmatimonadaceae bacterium]
MPDNSSDLDEETPGARWRELARLERWLDKPMLALAIVWLVLVVLELTTGLSPFMEGVGIAIWIAFIGDFVLRLVIAPDRARYLRASWLTAISLLVPALRIFRAFRVLRVLRAARAARGFRLVRVVGAVNRGMNRLGDSMHRKGFGYVVALTLLVTVLGAAGMYAFERGAGEPAGITDFPSALWWTAMIITTMGSGYWPVTPEGRILCVLLSLYALGILGYLAAALAAYFVGRDEELAGQHGKSAQLGRLIAEVADLRAEVRELRPRG